MSLFLPPVEESDEDKDTCCSVDSVSRQQLNRFLQLRDISPVRASLSVPWREAQERTKRRYMRKAEQCISAVLEVLAPEDAISLLNEVCERHATSNKETATAPPRSVNDVELIEAFAESYLSAKHWSTRRQILSMMADKLSFVELKEYIPVLTRYRYNIARKHRLLHGRAAPLPTPYYKRMRIDLARLQHFICFITSPHVIQDVPFGEKILKLSTGEFIKTPNVIRTMIPERIVQQYQQYCVETMFEPMSKRSLQRVMSVCSASTRKSLQGLDNFSAQGCDAFDNLDNLVEKLCDFGKTPAWTRDIKQKLRLSKQYLKCDFKVRDFSTC